jgi:hypothetical protein
MDPMFKMVVCYFGWHQDQINECREKTEDTVTLSILHTLHEEVSNNKVCNAISVAPNHPGPVQSLLKSVRLLSGIH